MYLMRKYGYRKKSKRKVYLYIRRRGINGYWGPDIPLGRMDKKEPQKKIKAWLESSHNLPPILQLLAREDIKELYKAITIGGHWYRIERHLCTAERFEISAHEKPW